VTLKALAFEEKVHKISYSLLFGMIFELTNLEKVMA